jgi:hypothetical protein
MLINFFERFSKICVLSKNGLRIGLGCSVRAVERFFPGVGGIGKFLMTILVLKKKSGKNA